MFDRYMICEDGFGNVVGADGRTTGFQLGTRLPYYRGIPLSLIEELALTVDGEKIDAARMKLTLRGRIYTRDEMAEETRERWEFGEVGVLTLDRPGGLAPGRHDIELVDRLRISYLPFPLIGIDRKTLELSAR